MILGIFDFIGNMGDKIKNFFDIMKDLYNVFLNFLPSPLNHIFNTFLIALVIIIIAKLINIIGETIS